MIALEEDEETLYKERADFIDQITFLLEKKEKIANMNLNNRKIQ